MMRFIYITAITAAAGFLFQWLWPWWSVAIAAGLAALSMGESSYRASGAGALGAGLLWLLAALWLHLPSDGVLAGRMAGMLGGLPAITVYLITTAIGSITGGLGALTGYYLRKLITG